MARVREGELTQSMKNGGGTWSIKRMGNITEITQIEKYPSPPPVKKIDKDRYVYIETGEIRNYEKSETRKDNVESIKKSIKRLRDIINTNLVEPENCRWVTLTYKECMTDTKRLYKDFDSYRKRFNRYLEKNGIPIPEYIAVIEPQRRCAWHFHIIYIWKCKAPFIKNEILSNLWSWGFVNIKAMDNVDNAGAYFSAYLTDIETEGKEGESKKYIKGGRLNLYPPGTNLYRTSRGIIKPITEKIRYEELQKDKGQLGKLTYSRVYDIIDDTGATLNTVSKTYYNTKRK